MNRRELFQQLAGAMVVNGVPLQSVEVIPAHRRPVLAIFEVSDEISLETANRMLAAWNAGIKGTPLEGLKAVVIGRGLRLTVLERCELESSGHICNQRIEEWLRDEEAHDAR
jgi:hypothetical protein